MSTCVHCGECCSFWRDVEEFEQLAKDPVIQECPHLTDHGCSLPRKDRPDACVEYLCELGWAASQGLLSQSEIVYYAENRLQEDPDLAYKTRVRRGLAKNGWQLPEERL